MGGLTMKILFRKINLRKGIFVLMEDNFHRTITVFGILI